MYKVWKVLLLLSLTSCDASAPQVDSGADLDPCDRVIKRLEECIGARPALIGVCTSADVDRLLLLSCGELLQELSGG